MAKILLIVPSAPTFYGKPRYPVLGLSMIGASLLRAGHTVRAIDLRLQPDDDSITVRAINDFKPDMVGFTVTNWDFNSAVKHAVIVKQLLPDAVTVFGGPQPTLCPDETIRQPSVDIVVRGEGEITVVELSANIHQNEEFDKIKGIVFKKIDGEIIITEDRPLIDDLSTLPMAAYELFDISSYAAGNEKRLGIYSTRGCPYGCTFCTGRTLMGRRIRCRSPEDVVAEMRYWHGHAGINHFNFVEDNCLGRHGHGEALLMLIEEARIPVTFSLEVGVRADALTEDICTRLKRSGCTIVAIGIESVDPEVLTLSNKGETIEDIRLGIRAAKAAGLFVKGYFIVGLPGDTPEKVRECVRFAQSEEIDMPRFALAQAFPHTELEQWVRSNGHFYYEPYMYVLEHTDEFHSDVHYDFPGFAKEDIWKMYRWAHDQAQEIAFSQALRRKFGNELGRILNLLNNAVVRKFIIWLYQNKIVSLPK